MRRSSGFAQLLRIPTVSRSDPADEDRGAFARFRVDARRAVPAGARRLELELIDGGEPAVPLGGEGTGRPSVLMAHHDVVPADEPGWPHDPFAAELVDGRIWGRGTLDDKGTLVALLEAIEARLADRVHARRRRLRVLGRERGDRRHGRRARRRPAHRARRAARPRARRGRGGGIGCLPRPRGRRRLSSGWPRRASPASGSPSRSRAATPPPLRATERPRRSPARSCGSSSIRPPRASRAPVAAMLRAHRTARPRRAAAACSRVRARSAGC